jgi:hypothetical protein
MDNTQIKNTIEHFKEDGTEVRVRDIAFTLLSKMFSDSKTAYQCLFGSDGFDEYVTDDMRSKLETYLTEQGYIKSVSTDAETGGITFAENKHAMERMLMDIQKDMEDGIIERKDGYARMESIRTKLNDKFKVEAAEKDRMIVVERKYNSVCANCHHEIYIPTEEELIEKYGLVKKE